MIPHSSLCCPGCLSSKLFKKVLSKSACTKFGLEAMNVDQKPSSVFDPMPKKNTNFFALTIRQLKENVTQGNAFLHLKCVILSSLQSWLHFNSTFNLFVVNSRLWHNPLDPFSFFLLLSHLYIYHIFLLDLCQWRTQDFFKGGGVKIGPKNSQRLSQPHCTVMIIIYYILSHVFSGRQINLILDTWFSPLIWGKNWVIRNWWSFGGIIYFFHESLLSIYLIPIITDMCSFLCLGPVTFAPSACEMAQRTREKR